MYSREIIFVKHYEETERVVTTVAPSTSTCEVSARISVKIPNILTEIFVVVFLSLFRQYLDTISLHYDRVLPDIFQFNSHPIA
jgi:hypothetical protein